MISHQPPPPLQSLITWLYSQHGITGMTKQKVISFFSFPPNAFRQSPVKLPLSASGQNCPLCSGSKDPHNCILTLSKQPCTMCTLMTLHQTCSRSLMPLAAMVVIPLIIQAMILLNALLCEYENIGQMLLQTETIATLTFKVVQDGILAEHACHSNHLGSSSTKALKISNVKPKGANPKWQPRKGNDYKGKQKESSAKPHEQAHKKHCRNRSGKQQREKQAKKMNASLAQHSHLASSFEAPPRSFTTINSRGTATENSMAFIKEVPVSLPTKDP